MASTCFSVIPFLNLGVTSPANVQGRRRRRRRWRKWLSAGPPEPGASQDSGKREGHGQPQTPAAEGETHGGSIPLSVGLASQPAAPENFSTGSVPAGNRYDRLFQQVADSWRSDTESPTHYAYRRFAPASFRGHLPVGKVSQQGQFFRGPPRAGLSRPVVD
jgi:hypothetical protein